MPACSGVLAYSRREEPIEEDHMSQEQDGGSLSPEARARLKAMADALPDDLGRQKEKDVQLKLCGTCLGTGQQTFVSPSLNSTITSLIPCATCQGTGYVKVDETSRPVKKSASSLELCDHCFGTGQQTLGSSLACTTCNGTGWVNVN